jgi:hypothetical protein
LLDLNLFGIKESRNEELGLVKFHVLFSQRSRDNWLGIDSAMTATATERFDILFE